VDIRFEKYQQPTWIRVTKDNHVVHAAHRGDELGSLARRKHGSPGTFETRDRQVVVDGDNQSICFGRGALQVPDVADVQQVETAVGERERTSSLTVARDSRQEICLGEDHLFTCAGAPPPTQVKR